MKKNKQREKNKENQKARHETKSSFNFKKCPREGARGKKSDLFYFLHKVFIVVFV